MGDFERPPREETRTATETLAHQHLQVPHQQEGAAPSTIDKKATVLQFTTEEMAVIRTLQATATKHTVLGQLPGPSPGIQVLRDWCNTNLHPSIQACALVGNGFFEVLFSSTEGTRQTLSRVYYFDGQEIQFLPWHADFSAHNPSSATTLEFPIWLQFLGLGLHFRGEAFLRMIGSKFGQVLHYDDGASFAGRTAGARVKILVKANLEIPEKILLPGSHPGVLHSHKLLVTSNPNGQTNVPLATLSAIIPEPAPAIQEMPTRA